MPGDIIPFFQYVLLIPCLQRIIVMNHIGDTVFISPVRDYPDMILKYNNIPALPFVYLRNICCKADRRVFKINL